MALPTLDQIKPSPKTASIAGALAVANAIVTALATSTSSSNVTGAGLNGSVGAASMALPRTISVTTTASAASYLIGSPIVVTGTDATGATVTENLTLTLVGGGETITGFLGFVTVTNIAIPAMGNVSGSFTFGVRDILLAGGGCRAVLVGTAGALHITNSHDGTQDTIGSKQVTAVPKLDIEPSKIWGDAATTAQDITVLY